ncbi:MAG: histidinol dehydrogenase, partial [Bifidobacteriaceae bacterium]|nr:histidinol dehydrogenase [Bifidobacteriaceae bacterium]
MMRTIDLRGTGELSPERVESLLPRAERGVDDVIAEVRPLLEDIQARGAAALTEQAERFDGVAPIQTLVPPRAAREALAGLDPAVRRAMEVAIERTRRVHAAQVPPDNTVEVAPGAAISQRWIPVRRVGLYVPGGLAVYPSSVIMNAVPAQEAGVRQLAVASPPKREFGGWPHPAVLAACALLGVEEIYAAGGVSAIGLFAYGVPGVAAKVDVVTGPGNLYVVTAKRLVMGRVGIDSEAGPTEIAIIADGGANAEFVAADLVSQAEHDPLAAAVLITDSPDLAREVGAAVERRAGSTKHAERVGRALGGAQSAIVLVEGLAEAVQVANAYAAEHLELQVADPAAVAEAIHCAGAIFVGPYSPVPLGDYLAGSNHVLPTAGNARFASGLGVTAFLKSVQQIEYSEAALDNVASLIEAFALAEDLPAHSEAIRTRIGPPAPALTSLGPGAQPPGRRDGDSQSLPGGESDASPMVDAVRLSPDDSPERRPPADGAPGAATGGDGEEGPPASPAWLRQALSQPIPSPPAAWESTAPPPGTQRFE